MRETLTTALGKPARAFGQPVSRAEVLAAAQSTPGVVAARIASFTRVDLVEEVDGFLPCAPPRPTTGAPLPVELLYLDPARLRFEEMLP